MIDSGNAADASSMTPAASTTVASAGTVTTAADMMSLAFIVFSLVCLRESGTRPGRTVLDADQHLGNKGFLT